MTSKRPKINIFTLMIIIAMVFLMTTCLDLNETLNYENCSTERTCLNCENEYICNQCAQRNCCPKRCTSCSNSTHCNQCQLGFVLYTQPQKGWKICRITNAQMDYNRIHPPSFRSNYITKPTPDQCKLGYFMQPHTYLCQKCRISNCQTCLDSIHCHVCQYSYLLYNDRCATQQQIDDFLNPKKQNTTTPNQSLTQNQTSEIDQADQTAQFNKIVPPNLSFEQKLMKYLKISDKRTLYLVILSVGICLGSSSGCILFGIFLFIRKKYRSIFRRFFSQAETKQLSDQQDNGNPQPNDSSINKNDSPKNNEVKDIIVENDQMVVARLHSSRNVIQT